MVAMVTGGCSLSNDFQMTFEFKMAASRFLRSFLSSIRIVSSSNVIFFRNFGRQRRPNNQRQSFNVLAGGFLVTTVALVNVGRSALVWSTDTPKSKQQGFTPSLSEASKPRLTNRERRFVKFASIEYEGQLYMTPQDFLESVTDSEPRPRLKRRVLTTRDLENLQNGTPHVRKTSSTFFRNLHDRGMVSYTEYLFLLSILTSEYDFIKKEPHSGFQIAFNMFDTDGNRRVDRHEFLVLAHLVAQYAWKESGWAEYLGVITKRSLERIFSYARLARQKARRRAERGQTTVDDDEFDEEELAMDAAMKEELANVVNTTLIVHFFGKKGQGLLCYDDFRLFMENLQTEVLQIEFHEFSKGLPTISELDFAKILHRYTLLHSDDYDAYLSRLNQRIQQTQGITFDEFKAFCQFLNNLEDFSIAMRMYTMADQPISPEEFSRAVKICTGQTLSRHLVETVFQIFDEDNDGHLSYKEFIAIMRDRLHRGIKRHTTKNEGWDAFKSCVKEEMRNAL